MNVIEIVPTNTCPPNLSELTSSSRAIAAFSKDVQLDISDGVFTNVRSWPYGEGQWAEVESMASSSLPLSEILTYEIHLMVEDPVRIGALLARAGSRRIIAHTEVFADADGVSEAFALWRKAGAREIGLAILIETPLSALEPHISHCDVVQVMSITTLGSQGASYDARAVSRIEELHLKYPSLTIEVDGGVGESNIKDLARAGARRFGVGSAIMKAADPAAAYTHLKDSAEKAI